MAAAGLLPARSVQQRSREDKRSDRYPWVKYTLTAGRMKGDHIGFVKMQGGCAVNFPIHLIGLSQLRSTTRGMVCRRLLIRTGHLSACRTDMRAHSGHCLSSEGKSNISRHDVRLGVKWIRQWNNERSFGQPTHVPRVLAVGVKNRYCTWGARQVTLRIKEKIQRRYYNAWHRGRKSFGAVEQDATNV